MFVGKSNIFLWNIPPMLREHLCIPSIFQQTPPSLWEKWPHLPQKNSAIVEGKHPHFLINNSAGFEVNVWEILHVGSLEKKV